MPKKGSTVFLSNEMVILIDRLKRLRRDPTRATTIRYIIMRIMADLDLLSEEEKKLVG